MGKINWSYVMNGAASCFGFYVFVVAAKMKVTGKISTFLMSEEEIRRCKDKAGFLKTITCKMLVFGLLMFGFGLVSIVNEALWKNWMIKTLAFGVFLLACGLFIICLRKARDFYIK